MELHGVTTKLAPWLSDGFDSRIFHQLIFKENNMKKCFILYNFDGDTVECASFDKTKLEEKMKKIIDEVYEECNSDGPHLTRKQIERDYSIKTVDFI